MPDVEAVMMHPLGGTERTLAEQLKLFHLVAVVLDPYTYESAWLLDTAKRILDHLSGADCRAAFVVTTDEAGARSFLGPLADTTMVFCDNDRAFVQAAELGSLPAFLHMNHDGVVVSKAEGWNPEAWDAVGQEVAANMSWSAPHIPAQGDPSPYPGTAALGAA